MNRGYVKLYRKMLDSKVFQNEGLFKVWVWCLLKANHETRWVLIKVGRASTEVLVKPGQFVFGRYSAAKELQMSPSTVWKRIKKLKNMGNCDIKSNSKYTIITIVNWDIYQMSTQDGDSKGDRQVTGKEHKQELKELKEERTPELFSLRERYFDQNLIDQVFDAIASTRKSNKVADSVLLAQLQKWKRYPVEQVESGIRTYLEKDYAGQGKDEAYLLGIIRNQNLNEDKRATNKPLTPTEYWAERGINNG